MFFIFENIDADIVFINTKKTFHRFLSQITNFTLNFYLFMHEILFDYARNCTSNATLMRLIENCAFFIH